MKTRRRATPQDKEQEKATDRRLSPRKKRKVQYNTEEVSPVDNGRELEEEDQESSGEDRQRGLIVTCGNKRGILHVEKLKMGEDCIDCEGSIFSPSAFENHGGKGAAKKWKSTIFYNDKPLQFWIDRGDLSSPRFKRRQSASSEWTDHKQNHKGSDAENNHKPEKTNKELVNVQNGQGIKTTVRNQKNPKLVLKKLPEEVEQQQPVEEDMQVEDTEADTTSEAQDNSDETEDKEEDTSSPTDHQNENSECEAETVPSPTHVQSPVEDVSPDVTDQDPSQQMPTESPTQSHSTINDAPASTLLSSSELDKIAFEQLKSLEEGEQNSSWSLPGEVEQQQQVEDTEADTTSEAQDNSEETEDKEEDTSSPTDHQNENAECEAETVPSPTHVQSPVEDVSPDVTDQDPSQQMPTERPQSHSPIPIKDTTASTLPSSSELDKMDIEEQESKEEDRQNMSAEESGHKDQQTQNEPPTNTKEEKVEVRIEESTKAIIADIKKTVLKKRPKLILKKLPPHILDSLHLQSSSALLNGRPLSKTEEVQNLEKDQKHDNAECEVQNGAIPSPTEDTLSDLTDPESEPKKLLDRPPQDALVPTPLTNTELDTMDLEQLKRPDLSEPEPAQETLMERPPQSHSPSPTKNATVTIPLANTEVDIMDLEQLTRPEPAQEKLMERPPQTHIPSAIKDALVPTPLDNTELDTMDLKQLKKEKIKLQLKVLKLQEEYYTLQLKKLNE